MVGETMLLAVPAQSIRENSSHFQTRLPSETGGIMNTDSSNISGQRSVEICTRLRSLRLITPDSRSALRKQRKLLH